MASQSESVEQQQATVKGEEKVVNVALETVSVKQHSSKLQSQSGGTVAQSGRKCSRCGRFPQHAYQQCPARNIICHCCGRKGHTVKPLLKLVQLKSREALLLLVF